MNQDELEKIKKNAWEIYSINNKDISLDYEDFSYGFYSGAEALQKELYVQQKEVDEWKYNYEAEIPRQVMMLEANKKIQKELDEARRIAAEKEAEAQKERLKAEAKAKAEAEARQRAENEAKALREAEIKRQAEIEAKAKADELAAKESARKAAAAPDKQKLIDFAQVIRSLELPTVKSEDGKKTLLEISEKVESFAKWIETQANKI